MYKKIPIRPVEIRLKKVGNHGMIICGKKAALWIRGIKRKSPKQKTKVKIVRTKKGQILKDRYSSDFNNVYYAFKRLSEKNTVGITSTDVFLDLERRIMRKDVLEMLNGASQSAVIASEHYIFRDKEQEERKKRAMDETLKKAENVFFCMVAKCCPFSFSGGGQEFL